MNERKLSLVFLVMLLLAFLAVSSFAVPGTMKNSGRIGGIAGDFARGISTCNQGNDFVIVGDAAQASIRTGNFESLLAKGGTDAIIAFFDYDSAYDNYAAGRIYNFGGGGNDALRAIVEIGNGGFTAAGESASGSFGNGDWSGISGYGKTDATAATSSDGIFPPLAFPFGTKENDQFFDVKVYGDYYMFAGNRDNDDIFIEKVTPTEIKQITLNSGRGTATLRSITSAKQASGTTVFPAVGYADGDTFAILSDWRELTRKGEIDGIVAITDGNSITKKWNFGGDGNDYFYKAIGNDSPNSLNGDFIVVGSSAAKSFRTDNWGDTNGKGNIDATIIRFDTNGNVKWKKNFGGSGSEELLAIAQTIDGNFVAVGYAAAASIGNGDFYGLTPKGNVDAIIVKFDPNGNIMWVNNFGGADDDYFNAVTVKNNGDIIAAGCSYEGSFNGGDFEGITPRGNADMTYAIFEDVKSFKIEYLKFANNPDIIYHSERVISGNTVELPATPERMGFVFEGWFTDEDCTIPFDSSCYAVSSDMIVYPCWRPVGNEITISYDNGSGNYNNITRPYGTRITIEPINNSVPFAYWEDDGNVIRSYDKIYSFVATENVTLKAVFSNNPPAPEPTVFVDSGNIIVEPSGTAGRINVSFFGDVVIPDGYTVVERGFIGAYYIPGRSDYDWNETNLLLGADNVYKVLVPGSNTKIQAIYKKILENTDFCARVFLTYSDGTGSDRTIYSDIAYYSN